MRGSKPEKTHEPLPELSALERDRIKGYLYSVACTETWVETIMAALEAKDARGKRLVKYAVTPQGRLKTKMPKLLTLIADALVYPPPADDLPRCYVDGQTYHVGSSMRPCLCSQCSPANGPRRLWPAHYMVRDHLSYTCSVNHASVDPELVASVDPDAELLADIAGGRVVTAGQAAEQMRVCDDAWRSDKIKLLKIESPEIVAALRGHQWTQVGGDVSVDDMGRETNGVRMIKRGLRNIGSLCDFLELGHALTEITGIDQAAASDILRRLAGHDRAPRMQFVRMRQRRLRTGTRISPIARKKKRRDGGHENAER